MDYDGRNKYSSIDSIKEESKNADVKQPRKRNHNAFGGDSKENTNNTSTSKENCFIKKEDIMLIPELEDDYRDDDPRVAHAPIKFSQTLPTLEELNSKTGNLDIFKYNDIDLSLLTRCLLPPHKLEESEKDSSAIWTFESLLRDITDDLVGIEKSLKQGYVNKTSTIPSK